MACAEFQLFLPLLCTGDYEHGLGLSAGHGDQRVHARKRPRRACGASLPCEAEPEAKCITRAAAAAAVAGAVVTAEQREERPDFCPTATAARPEGVDMLLEKSFQAAQRVTGAGKGASAALCTMFLDPCMCKLSIASTFPYGYASAELPIGCASWFDPPLQFGGLEFALELIASSEDAAKTGMHPGSASCGQLPGSEGVTAGTGLLMHQEEIREAGLMVVRSTERALLQLRHSPAPYVRLVVPDVTRGFRGDGWGIYKLQMVSTLPLLIVAVGLSE